MKASSKRSYERPTLTEKGRLGDVTGVVKKPVHVS